MKKINFNRTNAPLPENSQFNMYTRAGYLFMLPPSLVSPHAAFYAGTCNTRVTPKFFSNIQRENFPPI